MGEKAREIITGDKEWTISKLKKAYAHEWVVHYYASIAAKIVAGPHAATFEKIFEETAEEEHVDKTKALKELIVLGRKQFLIKKYIPTAAPITITTIAVMESDKSPFLFIITPLFHL